MPVSQEALSAYHELRAKEMELDPPLHPNPSQSVGEVRAQLKRARREQPEENRVKANVEAKMRQFNTGATRHTDEGKLDYEGFFDPLVLEAFAEYMHWNRVQADGELRTSDNWQKGIPAEAYMKSELRHVIDWWIIHRKASNNPGTVLTDEDRTALKNAICGALFNAMGYLHNLLKQESALEEIQNGVYQPRWADSPDAHPVL